MDDHVATTQEVAVTMGLIGFSTGGAWLASEVLALAGQVCQMQGAFVWLLYS